MGTDPMSTPTRTNADVLINLLTQLIHSPHPETANSIKKHLGWPPHYLSVDKPDLVERVRAGVNNDEPFPFDLPDATKETK